MLFGMGAITSEDIRQNLYIGILGRDPLATGDEAGLQYWTDEAARNNWTPAQLTEEFLKSAKSVLSTSTTAQRAFLAPEVYSAPLNAPVYKTVDQYIAAKNSGIEPATAKIPAVSLTMPYVATPSTNSAGVIDTMLTTLKTDQATIAPVTDAEAAAAGSKISLSTIGLGLAALFLLRR
jgi:hypothetical protein